MRSRIVHALALAALTALVAAGCVTPPEPTDQQLLTAAEDGTGATGSVFSAATSADGLSVAFSTASETVDAEDPGSGTFVRRTDDGGVERISTDLGSKLWISADGRWITWVVQNPVLPGNSIIKVHDLSDGTTVEIGRRFGTSIPAVVSESPEPNVVFGVTSTPYDSYPRCEVVDLATLDSTTCPVPYMGPDAIAGGISTISPDGTKVVQKTLVPSGDTTAVANHVWDREADETVTVFTTRNGHATNISDDGRYLFGFDDLGSFRTDLFPGAGGEIRPDLGGSDPGTAGPPHGVVATSPDGSFAVVAQRAGDAWTLHRWDLRESTPTGFGITRPLGTWGGIGVPPVCSPGGSMTADGGVCTMSSGSFADLDTNDTTDAYLARP